jgi:hypothetical protein
MKIAVFSMHLRIVDFGNYAFMELPLNPTPSLSEPTDAPSVMTPLEPCQAVFFVDAAMISFMLRT